MSLLHDRRSFLPAVEGGDGVKYTGWQESLPGLVARLRRSVRGIKERLVQPTEDVSEWPGCVAAQKIFVPETGVEEVDTAQDNTSNPVNFVVRSGKTYRIAVKFPGPGVFVGRWLKVACYMKFHDPSVPEDQWLPIVVNTQLFQDSDAPINWTTRFSVYPAQPAIINLPVTNSGIFASPALNFVWNIEDPRTGRRYADRDLSQQFLKPRTWLPAFDSEGVQTNGSLPDGDLYDLHQPYVLERDGQLTFLIRPLTDFLQFDSSLDGTDPEVGLPFDDRVNGVRDQSVLVQVELHGARFETMQDMVHSGALTQKW